MREEYAKSVRQDEPSVRHEDNYTENSLSPRVQTAYMAPTNRDTATRSVRQRFEMGNSARQTPMTQHRYEATDYMSKRTDLQEEVLHLRHERDLNYGLLDQKLLDFKRDAEEQARETARILNRFSQMESEMRVKQK